MNLETIKLRYRNWHYKNTFFLILSLLLLVYLVKTDAAKYFIFRVEGLGHLGILLTGIFFVSTFTVAPASVVLYNIAGRYDPFEIMLLGGLGSMLGDYLIFRFLKDRVFEELETPFVKLLHYPRNIFQSPFFAWFMPVVGAVILASPLPDEVGIGLLGISKMKNWQFALLSFILNSLGMLVLVYLFVAIGSR